MIVCWPLWSRRERLESTPQNLTSDNDYLKTETAETDKNNFLKNVFLVEKFAETNRCKTFHCFADETYQTDLQGVNVLEDYTIKNCWPYWDSYEQRQLHGPSLARDGVHYGVENHKRFAEIFLEAFGNRLK